MLLVLGLALVASGGYAAAYLTASNKVPVGTSVGGVDIGGHTPVSAVAMLRDGLAGRTWRVRPGQVGLDVDYTASVRAAGAQRSWSPARMWAYYTGGDRLDPVKLLDQGRLGAPGRGA